MTHKRFLLTLIFFLLFFLLPLSPISADGKIYALFVWGTNEYSIARSALYCKLQIESSLSLIGIDSNSPEVAAFVTLTGNNAVPEQILETVQKLSAAAGEEDALLVYFLCHGECRQKKRIRYHYLLPGITDFNYSLYDLLPRASIFNAMTSQQHRLNILITDSCSVISVKNIGGPDYYYAPEPIPQNSLFKSFLLYSRGNLNINSSDPNGGVNGNGERAMAWIPGDNKTSPVTGSIFTNAINRIVRRSLKEEKVQSVTPDILLAILKKETFVQYDNLKEFLEDEKDPAVRFLWDQKTQTVTAFLPDGSPDDTTNRKEILSYDTWFTGKNSSAENEE